jgi:hypothetical protein
MSKDLIERLRSWPVYMDVQDIRAAADRIEQLEAEVEKFNAAKQAFYTPNATLEAELAALKAQSEPGYWRKCHEIAEATNKALRAELDALNAELAHVRQANANYRRENQIAVDELAALKAELAEAIEEAHTIVAKFAALKVQAQEPVAWDMSEESDLKLFLEFGAPNSFDGVSWLELSKVIKRFAKHYTAPPPSAEDSKLPNLMPVILWLENGCDPKEAAKELRLYHAAQGDG